MTIWRCDKGNVSIRLVWLDCTCSQGTIDRDKQNVVGQTNFISIDHLTALPQLNSIDHHQVAVSFPGARQRAAVGVLAVLRRPLAEFLPGGGTDATPGHCSYKRQT